jgi:integrase/recombinase XerC
MVKDRFVAYIQFEKRYSPHTVTAYRNDLDQFYSYLDLQFGLSEIREVMHPMIRSWIVCLIEQGMKPRSINRKLTTLKSFFKFLLREGAVDQNPMRKIATPKDAKRLPVFLEKEHIRLLLDEIDFDQGFSGLRDRLIIEMFYATGMRLSELVMMKETDLDFHHCTVKVLGKRNKERLIPFSNKIRDLLKSYLEERSGFISKIQISAEKGKEDSLYLFLTDSGRNIYPKMVYRIVNRYLSKVTTLKKRSPHILRHTFATHLLNNGAELNAVKELLGHANLSATQVYTHNTIEKLKKVYKQAHPKA